MDAQAIGRGRKPRSLPTCTEPPPRTDKGSVAKKAEGVDYRRKKDNSVSYRVRRREGGRRDGPTGSYTYDDLESAKIFRGALVANGFRDPYKNPAFAEMLGLAAQPAEVLTFIQVANKYLATLVDAERRTIGQCRTTLEDHFFSAVVTLPDGTKVGPLGRLPIDEFTGDIIQAWINQMREKQHGKTVLKPYSPKTILNIHGTVISPVFEYAIDKEYSSLAAVPERPAARAAASVCCGFRRRHARRGPGRPRGREPAALHRIHGG
jgi:hypothetical protein